MYQPKIISSINSDFINSSLQNLASELEVSLVGNPDLLIIQPEKTISIGIKQMRVLKEWLLLKPFNKKVKMAIIYEAELLTREAQNSILKILEEPPQNVMLILLVDNYKKLLPTIISRCYLLESNLGEQADESTYANVRLNEANLLERLKIVNKILSIKDSSKQLAEINNFLVSLAGTSRRGLFHDPYDKNTLQNLELISETWEKVKKNVSKRLALENLIINLN